MGIVICGVILGFAVPLIYFWAALTAIKYAFDKNLPLSCVAPHGVVVEARGTGVTEARQHPPVFF